MDKVIIAGGTGFLGLSLAKHLSERGFRPVIIGRNKPIHHVNFDFIQWDAVHLGEWVHSIEGA